VKGPLFVAAVVLASGACALAQDSPVAAPAPSAAAPQAAAPQNPAPPMVVPQAPAVPVPGASLTADKRQRIYYIRQLEGMLTNAVRTGAARVADQLKVGEPNSLFVTGNARTRGFELEGYGVFFDVDVPTMMQSVLWSSQMLQRQQELDQLRETIADPRTTDGMRRVARYELNRLERALSGTQTPAAAPTPIANPAQGVAVAATTDATAGDAALTRPDAAPAAVRARDSRTPDEIYTENIKDALIDAMLNFGTALRIADNEWLTIAARATSQAMPGTLDDAQSIVLRIKGSDLTAYLTGKITRDEAIKRVETKES
jgi:hypothetical protein